MNRNEIVSISEASLILGVNEATLRQWTDEGQLRAFITPGGHRRYSRAELKKFTQRGQRTTSIKDLACSIKETTIVHGEIAREFLAHYRQGDRLSKEYQERLAELGRRLLQMLIRLVSEPAKREDTIRTANTIGQDFGRLLAELELPLTDAVEAYIRHRDPIMKAAVHLINNGEVVGGRVAEAIPLANHLLDEALLALIAAHQQYHVNRKETVR